MMVSKMMCALFFLQAITIGAMNPDADQKKWIANARAAIKGRAAADLGEAMLHITDQKVKKHFFRKIAREQPEDILLLEAILATDLDLASPADKETLAQFVERKNVATHITLIKKYLVIKELDLKATPMEASKPAQLEVAKAKPVEEAAPKPSQITKAVSFKESEPQAIEDVSRTSQARLALSKSGKIKRRSLKS